MENSNNQPKKVVYSGIQPTGIITIGNYIGAIDNWLKLQNDYNSIFGIADLHALTVRQNPAEYRARALSFFAQYLAAGIDPNKAIIYFQSHVPEHTELSWILNCYTYVGEMTRMTQFKDKSQKNEDNINMGLLDYPVLMASDILLYQTDLVPVGVDQKQHLEITRDIATRFNNLYSPTFVVPEAYIAKQGAKVFSLQDPTAKMSKSDPDPNASVAIIEDPDSIMRKFKRAVTDCETTVEIREDKPGIMNLLTIMSVMTGESMESLAERYRDGGYAKFKQAVGESVVEKLRPLREEYARLMQDKGYLMQVAKDGAEKARYLARKTVSKVKRKIGLVELK
ncbi:MAG: tryptophan--tRNA ligase [Clostridia bacterium]|nr:tryptophan--tRNA ligase [Clostridia bacterium]